MSHRERERTSKIPVAKQQVGDRLPLEAVTAMTTFAQSFEWTESMRLDVIMETFKGEEMRMYEKGIYNIGDTLFTVLQKCHRKKVLICFRSDTRTNMKEITTMFSNISASAPLTVNTRQGAFGI